MTLTYNNNVPAANNDPSQDQPDMLLNTQNIKTFLDVNHYDFSTTNYGKHIEVRLPETSNPTTLVNEASLFCKVGSDPAETDLYYASENAGTIYQLTRVDEANSATFAVNGLTGGWTFLPGGLIMQWGQIIGAASGTAVTFPKALTNIVYNVQLTPYGTSAALSPIVIVDATSTSTSGFKIYSKNPADIAGVFWVAIGK